MVCVNCSSTSPPTHLLCHAHHRLSDLVTLVDSGLQAETCGSEDDRMRYGEHLKSSINNFTNDFIPHMDEEEKVSRGQRLSWVQGSMGCLGSKVELGSRVNGNGLFFFQVYLPLLLEYFSETELRQLTSQVLELHELPETLEVDQETLNGQLIPNPQTLHLATPDWGHYE